MNVSVRAIRPVPSERKWLESAYSDYLTDLAPLNTGLFPALTEFGHQGHDQLDAWFADSSVSVLCLFYGDKPVGFAVVRQARRAPGQTVYDYSMAEFFVSRSWRRRGIGQQAVRLILDRFAGRWEILEHLRNPEAVKFWRKTVAQYAGRAYRESVQNGEVRQYFQSGPRRPS